MGWLDSLDLLPDVDTTPIAQQKTLTETITSPTSDAFTYTTTTANDSSEATMQPLLSNMFSTNTGPSPEYLQSLLHVNEVLLAQSLANTEQNSNDSNQDIVDHILNTPILTPMTQTDITEEEEGSNSPLFTPSTDNDNDDDENNTRFMDPDSEKITSPLNYSSNKQYHLDSSNFYPFTTTANNNNNIQL